MAETIGRILKAEREAQSFSVEDVAHALKVPPARIRDIEDDDFSNFANPTYARFFFRLYCRHLGVETSEELSLLAGGNLAGLDDYEYLRNEPVPLTPRTPRIRDRMSRWRRGMRTFATGALTLAFIIAIFSGMLYYTAQRLGKWQEDRELAAAQAPPAPEPQEPRPIQAYLPSEIDPEAPAAGQPESLSPAQAAADQEETQKLLQDIEAQRSEAEALVGTANLTDEQLRQMAEVVTDPAPLAEEAIAAEAGETLEPEPGAEPNTNLSDEFPQITPANPLSPDLPELPLDQILDNAPDQDTGSPTEFDELLPEEI